MQTFLPYPDLLASAKVLDNKRLGKQRSECKQILKALRGEYAATGAWVNHSATRMWRGYEDMLCIYARYICAEWRRRGFEDTLLDYFVVHYNTDYNHKIVPRWLGAPELHASHRSNLLRKDPGWYSQFGWTEPDNLPYVWPV